MANFWPSGVIFMVNSNNNRNPKRKTLWRSAKQPLLALTCSLLLISSNAIAVPHCAPAGEVIPYQSSLASAGFFANLRNSETSVNYQMDQMLANASTNRIQVATERPLCGTSCGGARLAIIFSSTPNLRLSDYDESDRCEQLRKQTRAAPIVYAGRIFNSADEAREWYHDLTQGDGPDGEDLYQRCPGSCSPEYSSTIIRDKEKMIISTTIVCGHARDKDDGQYQLESAFRWVCP